MPRAKNGQENQLVSHWYSRQPLLNWPLRMLLWIVAQVYRLLTSGRHWWVSVFQPPRRVPGLRVVAVGNLIVGGAGKTPCVIGLAQGLKDAGLICGLVTRGYRSQAEHQASRVIDPIELSTTSAAAIGDEAWLLAWRTQLPIAVGSNRLEGAQALKKRYPDMQVVLLDDGLQQRFLKPDQRLLVLDERGFGNGHCLPLGPLREPIGNLRRFDAWIDNGFHASPDFPKFSAALPPAQGLLSQSNAAWVPLADWANPSAWLDLQTGLETFKNQRLLAIAGIAVPTRFFETLGALGLSCETLALDDHDPDTVDRVHAALSARSFDAVLMTEKDAVKFFNQTPLPSIPAWALRRTVELDQDFLIRLVHGLKTA